MRARLSRYGCSKWAVEVLLRDLHERHGIPVSIFRCGMILSHSRCASTPCAAVRTQQKMPVSTPCAGLLHQSGGSPANAMPRMRCKALSCSCSALSFKTGGPGSLHPLSACVLLDDQSALRHARRYLGQINPTDFFTRLLCSIVHTGLVPGSFYALPHGPEEHFDGMPIDFVSAVIASTTLAERADMATYHVVNPHWWAATQSFHLLPGGPEPAVDNLKPIAMIYAPGKYLACRRAFCCRPASCAAQMSYAANGLCLPCDSTAMPFLAPRG